MSRLVPRPHPLWSGNEASADLAFSNWLSDIILLCTCLITGFHWVAYVTNQTSEATGMDLGQSF